MEMLKREREWVLKWEKFAVLKHGIEFMKISEMKWNGTDMWK